MRLLHCQACKSIDEIPDYEGKEEVDPLVERVVLDHNKRDPMAHGSAATLPMRLAHVDDGAWLNDRENVIKELNRTGMELGFDPWPWASESHNVFKEDAMKCWNQHRNPELPGKPCIDYMSESKRIGRPTAEGKAVLKENVKLGKTDPHLCQWCPYQTTVLTEMRARKGMYRDQSPQLP